jgi:hypothetical protein
MKIRIPKRFVIVFAIGLLVVFALSCAGSGGGGGDDDSASDRTYHLTDDGEFEPGYMVSFSLSGGDDQGNDWTAEFTRNTKNKIQFNGATVTPIDTLIVMTIENMAPTSSLATAYYDQNNQLIQMFDSGTGVTWTPTTNPTKPETAQIGEIGSLPTLLGDDGAVQTGYWQLQQGSGVLANYTSYLTMKDSNENTVALTELTIVIDESGDPKSIIYKVSLIQQGVTVTMSGNRTI